MALNAAMYASLKASHWRLTHKAHDQQHEAVLGHFDHALNVATPVNILMRHKIVPREFQRAFQVVKGAPANNLCLAETLGDRQRVRHQLVAAHLYELMRRWSESAHQACRLAGRVSVPAHRRSRAPARV